MGESIAEAAAGLTKAQRGQVIMKGEIFGMPFAGATMQPLIRKGIFERVERKGFQTRWALTEHGAALRNHLISQGADHDLPA